MQFAIKSIKLYDKNTRNQFKNDLKVLSANKCKNIISFYGAFFTEGNVKILLEFMNYKENKNKKISSSMYTRKYFIKNNKTNFIRFKLFTQRKTSNS